MNGIMKVLTGILAVLAVTASLATAGIIGYSMIRPQEKVEENGNETQVLEASTQAAEVPTTAPEASAAPDAGSPTPTPLSQPSVSDTHVHDYEETVDKKATCYSAGRIKYTCRECQDTYYVDVMSTGHLADEWEVVRKPSADREGLRVRKCIYCDEIVAQENILFEDGSSSSEEEKEAQHIHQYTASTEREASCILAGLRKHTCSCGNFYTESIPAVGHVATDWEVAAEPSVTRMGTEQRTCNVCGVVLDSRPLNKLTPSPSATESPSATAAPNQGVASPGASGGNSQSTPTPAPTATPSPTPHTHDYQSYVLKQANCSQIGVRSFVCTCGSSYAEEIERDLNNHTYQAVVIPATSTTQGYTVYTCVRCNYSYFDNYTPALSNGS